MGTAYIYRDVKSVEGLKCTSDGRFEYKGRTIMEGVGGCTNMNIT